MWILIIELCYLKNIITTPKLIQKNLKPVIIKHLINKKACINDMYQIILKLHYKRFQNSLDCNWYFLFEL